MGWITIEFWHLNTWIGSVLTPLLFLLNCRGQKHFNWNSVRNICFNWIALLNWSAMNWFIDNRHTPFREHSIMYSQKVKVKFWHYSVCIAFFLLHQPFVRSENNQSNLYHHSGRMLENNKLMPQSKSNRVPCQMCGVEFGKAKYLSQHMLIHEGKTFACSMCSKTFSSRIRLNGHKYIHT